jgi:hypothetical protein
VRATDLHRTIVFAQRLPRMPRDGWRGEISPLTFIQAGSFGSAVVSSSISFCLLMLSFFPPASCFNRSLDAVSGLGKNRRTQTGADIRI